MSPILSSQIFSFYKHAIFVVCAFAFIAVPGLVHAEPLNDTLAKQAIIYDAQTQTVIFEKNADQRMPTSSMSKVLTMIVVFDALKDGRLDLKDKLLVSEKAWRKGGSKMFLEYGTRVTVEDLIRGVIIQSGNDATITLAEGLAGSEEEFVKLLNIKADQIGMKNSNFMNASGWPDKNHYSTARDLLKMSIYLAQTYPEYYHYYSEKEFTYNGIKQLNRNPLIHRNMGADGIKTGHTEAAGYGLIGSAVQDGRRIYMIANGLQSKRFRSSESSRLMAWTFSDTENVMLTKSGQIIENVPVWLGKKKTVPLVTIDDIETTILKADKTQSTKKVRARLIVDRPIPAPIEKGQEIATLVLELPSGQEIKKPLYAGEASPKLGLIGQAMEKIRYTLFGLDG